MPQIPLMTEGYNLSYNFVHPGHLGHIIGRIVRTEHHEVHTPDLDAIVGFQHVAVEILLEAIMIEGCIGKVDAVETHPSTKGLHDGLPIGIHHLATPFPVVESE